jgi:hypothetical protein
MQKMYKTALALSLAMMILWSVMGTSTSLAWFTDTDDEVKNVFHFADFNWKVSHRLANGDWEEVDQTTKVFDDEALYEPGYVQVVYLKVENLGTMPFDCKTAVSVSDYSEPSNVFGQKFHLQDYLKFGIIAAETEERLFEQVATRNLAEEIANMPLSNYATDATPIAGGGTVYMALIVRMPKEVDNVANYREDIIPYVALGLVVSATQQTE